MEEKGVEEVGEERRSLVEGRGNSLIVFFEFCLGISKIIASRLEYFILIFWFEVKNNFKLNGYV